MNRNTRILLILLLVAAGAWYLISKKPWQTSTYTIDQFSFKDTAQIDKIFIADRRGTRILLQKMQQDNWTLNNKYAADVQKINLLKTTLHDVEIRNPVPKSEYNHVVSNMASGAVKVELYASDKLLKTIYVGESTPDGTGTYMMLEDGEEPYISHIPGFIGYLTPRFLPIEVKWKSKLVFDIEYDKIFSISVTYPDEPTSSFTLEQQNGNYSLKNSNGQVIPCNPAFAKYYAGSFTSLYLESYVDEISDHERDSILNRKPWCKLELKTVTGEQRKLTVYLKAIGERTKERYDDSGQLLDYDHDKYFAVIDDSKELAYIQQYNFGKLFRKLSEFTGTK